MGQGVDPVEITKAGLERAAEGGFDTVIVDTAGRQVVDDTLMTELKNIQVGEASRGPFFFVICTYSGLLTKLRQIVYFWTRS